jgi:hypothetical protein
MLTIAAKDISGVHILYRPHSPSSRETILGVESNLLSNDVHFRLNRVIKNSAAPLHNSFS